MKRVLLVDDDADILESLSAIFWVIKLRDRLGT